MSYSEELASKWRDEIVELENRALLWEGGQLRAYANGVEVTEEQAPMLRRHANALREAIAILESR